MITKEGPNDKVEVTKIDIKIGDSVMSLTPAQLRELRDILNDMLQ